MILVTGGTGFIGRRLIKKLNENGNKVRVLVRKDSDTRRLTKLKVELSIGELGDSESLKKATKGVDIVFHSAAMLGGPDVTYEQLYKANVEGTKNLIQACEKNKVKRFIHISSVAAMGPTVHMADESVRCTPATDYDKTKYLSEQALIKSKLDWTIIRPTMVYGPGELKNKAKLFQLVQKGLFKIIGNGDNIMSLVYIDNLLNGILLAAKSEKAIKEKYIISDSQPCTMNEFIGTLSRRLNVKTPAHIPKWLAYSGAFCFKLLSILKIPRLLTVERIKNLTTNHSFSIEKAKKELGYKPKISLEEGIKRTIEWYREEGVLK